MGIQMLNKTFFYAAKMEKIYDNRKENVHLPTILKSNCTSYAQQLLLNKIS